MFHRRLLCFLFAVSGLAAAENAACQPQAFVSNAMPLFQAGAALPEAAYEQYDESGTSNVSVTVLATVEADGRVAATEALDGPDFLRQTATASVRHNKYQPILRAGKPVCALIAARVVFITPGKPVVPLDAANWRAGYDRLQALQKQWPNSPEQAFADLQQELDIPGGLRRTLSLPRLAKAALSAGDLDKAAAYANEGLSSHGSGDGQSAYDCNLVLGEIAIRKGDLREAIDRLLAAGHTSGSPSLGSFGPNMTLAKDLLERGQRDAVLEFFTLCKSFWPATDKLDSWSAAVRAGKTPNFGPNLSY